MSRPTHKAGETDLSSRRQLIAQLATLTFLLPTMPVYAQSPRSSAGELPQWLHKVDALTALMRGDTLSIPEWQRGLDELFSKLPLEEVLEDIDFASVSRDVLFAPKGVSTTKLRLPNDEIRTLQFFPKIFAIDKGRAIIPHGHANMVSAHLLLQGRMYLRQYDQRARDEDYLWVRPTIDETIHQGHLAAIGETQDNVHWFIAEETAFTLDMIVTGLDAHAEKSFDIFNLDMDRAEPEGSDWRVPRLSVDAALAKYG